MYMIPNVPYVFNAKLIKVVDGDTVDMDIDAGLHCHRIERLRLLKINAPEVTGPTREAGLAAKEYVKNWFAAASASNATLVIQTYKSDVFGRYLADIWRTSDGANLNDQLIESGNAVLFI